MVALGLFATNAGVVAGLFHTAYIAQMGSNEGVYIGLARYISGHYGQLKGWFPLWYGGIPFADSYPPLVHLIVAALVSTTQISPVLAYHLVVSSVYGLGPVALFVAARCLGAGVIASGIGGLLYSFLSPSNLLVPEIRVDSGGLFGPRRLTGLILYGDSPHIASLVFLALAIGVLHLALERRRPVHYMVAAILVAAVAMTNWIGAFALALTAFCYLLAAWDRETGIRWLRRWLRAAAIGCFAYMIAMPWVTPSTINTIRTNAPKLVGWQSTRPERALAGVMVVGVLLIAALMRAHRVAPRVRFAAMFFWCTSVITLGAYWLDIKILPEPERYHLEMDLAFWLMVTLAAEPAIARLGGNGWPLARKYWGLIVGLACVPIFLQQHRRAQELEAPIDIARTAEFRISRWLGEHMPGRRVFAPGTTAFWMNAFSDTPIIMGGFDNGIRNQQLWDAREEIFKGDNLDKSVAWLKVLGCDALVGGDVASGEVYHPYKHPEKFHALRELWREGPEVIYAIPRVHSSLAHVLRPSDVIRETPRAGSVESLEPLLTALDDQSLPLAEFHWRSSSVATISGNLEPGQLLYVQVTWDEGWNASVDGESRKVWADGLGQIVVEPLCNGPCTVNLVWNGGPQIRLASIVSPVAMLGGLLWTGWEICRTCFRTRSMTKTQSSG